MPSNHSFIESIFPQFSVSDVLATADYYRDVLGFEILGFFGEPPVFTIVRRDQAEIYFNQLAPGQSQSRVRADGAYDAYLQVKSGVDTLAEELRARGASILEGPEDRVYGKREFVVVDTNGLILAFGEEIARSAENK